MLRYCLVIWNSSLRILNIIGVNSLRLGGFHDFTINLFYDEVYKFLILLQASDWDKYAAEEYELLVAEEGGAENHDDM